MSKIYGVYMAYNKYEVLPDEECNDPDIPKYPPEIARVRMYDNKRAQMDELLQQKAWPDVVFAATDIIAIGVYRAIQEKGIAIPKQIKVIGMKIKVSLLLATAALSLSAAVAQEGFRTIAGKKCQLYKVQNFGYNRLQQILTCFLFPDNFVECQ